MAGLFDDAEFEVPLLREPRRRRGPARGTALDARFANDYPPEWSRCASCSGDGVDPTSAPPFGAMRAAHPCPACRGMGSVKAMARLLAGHRCERCRHPYVPKGDAAMLGVEPSWRDGCEGWTRCDERCTHAGPIRWTTAAVPDEWLTVAEDYETPGWAPGSMVQMTRAAAEARGGSVEAAWRILTVHHLDGDKANLRWWNLAALCQRCHLEIQAKVVLDRVYPHEHSEWFKPHAAGYYAWVYLGEELTREETLARMDELLALELAPT